MRQEQRLIANELLRQERLRRGWSRAYIAEEIGVADPKTIGRWERGDAFPSAYFLQKLCTLFQMPAEALGLWQREHLADDEESSPAYLTHLGIAPTSLTQPLTDPALPPAPALDLVGREKLLAQLRARLEGNAIAALTGWPGVGKTALAIRLAHDEMLAQHFSDGVLWACLGPDCEPLDELRRWGRLLEVDETQFTHAESIDEWSQAIHARIGTRALLLVIDDAWTCQDALAFKLGGPNCAYLLTTRIPAVALYFAEAGMFRVNELDGEQSLQVLAHFVPALLSQESTALRALTRLAGGLPLALQLIGSHLRTHFYSGQPRRWRAAIERLQLQADARLQLTMPRSPLERQMGLPANAPISLYNEIELSYQRLPASAGLALGQLAHLAHPASSFSEEEALALPGVTLEALDSLLDAGLLASTGLGYYTFHQSIADFAQVQQEMAQHTREMPPQLSLLRQLRGYTSSPANHQEQPAYATLNEVVPALVQGAGDTAML